LDGTTGARFEFEPARLNWEEIEYTTIQQVLERRRGRVKLVMNSKIAYRQNAYAMPV